MKDIYLNHVAGLLSLKPWQVENCADMFEQGDTIVTTGYTNSFPKNVPVGRIVESYDRGGSFLSLKIELFTDFNRLNDVQVIFDEGLAERLELNKPDEPKKRAKSNNPDSVTTQAPVTK